MKLLIQQQKNIVQCFDIQKNIKKHDIFKSTQLKKTIFAAFAVSLRPPPVAQDLEVSHPSNPLLRNSRAEW